MKQAALMCRKNSTRGQDRMIAMRHRFTGRHMLFSLIGFFGIVIGVNLIMAVLAVRSFSGVVVENSYVASQNFNRWIAEGRREAALGWTLDITPMAGAVQVRAAISGQALTGGTGHVLFQHPLRQARDFQLPLHQVGPDLYRTSGPVPAGRWHVVVHFQAGGHSRIARQSLYMPAGKGA